MKEIIEMVITLIMAVILFWFGMVFLFIGRELYGSDATLLWASGILTFIGINGLGNFILYLWSKGK